MTKLTSKPNAEFSREKALLQDAQELLFQPGVQLRMTAAVLLCIFSALFPWMFPILNVFLAIPFELFITLPMLYGLAVMARKVKNGEELSLTDLFFAFAKNRYWYSITTMLSVILFVGLPILILELCIYGAVTVYSVMLVTPVASEYAIPVLVFGIMVCLFALIPVIFLEIPAFFLLGIRVKSPKISVFRAMKLSVRLLSRDLFRYFVLELKFLFLTLISCISVCTLFPIYTIPLFFLSNALYLDRLTDEAANQPS